MKISPRHYAILRDAIAPLAPKLSAHRDFVTKEGKAKDVEMRVRWDALHAAKIDGKPSCVWICAVPRTGRKIVGHRQDYVNHGLQCFPRGDGNAIEIFATKD